MPYINIDNTKIYYATNKRVWKKSEGLKLLFIHGAGGDHRVWVFQIEQMRNDYVCYALDLPGHGFSGGTGFNNIEGYAEFIEKFMIALSLKNSVLVGHSMGGAIIQSLALRHKIPILGIVLIGTGAKLKVSPLFLEKFKIMNEESADLFCKYAFSEGCPKDLLEKAKEMLLNTSSDVFYNDFIACNNFDLINSIQYIDIPTLIIGSDKDQMTPLRYSEFLAEKIGKSKLIKIEGSGHMMMLEQAYKVNEGIKSWLETEMKNVAIKEKDYR